MLVEDLEDLCLPAGGLIFILAGILNLIPGLVFFVGGGVFLTVVRVLLDVMSGVWGVVGLL